MSREDIPLQILELFDAYGTHLPWCRVVKVNRYASCTCGYRVNAVVSKRRQVDLPIAYRRKTDTPPST